MKDNTDSTKLNTELLFTLDVRVPDQIPNKIEVIDRVLAGVDPRNDLILIDPKIKTKHFLFRKRNNILTVHYLGRDGDTFLNGLPLEKGKLYILEKNDVLKIGKMEIIIRRETGISKATSSKMETTPLTDETPEVEPEVMPDEESVVEDDGPITIFSNMPMPSKKITALKKERIFNFSTIRLIPYKIYGFIVDVSLTYLLLGFILPSLNMLPLVHNFLASITDLLTAHYLVHHPELTHIKILATIEFFVCFHLFMLLSSFVLGTTPGAFLIGLHHKDTYKAFIAIRFKAYIYAIINIVALPLLIFDIPLYKGKNAKELITFSERDITASTIFKISRKAFTPIIVIACFLSPFFLHAPFTAAITIEKQNQPKFKDVHTNTLITNSSELGFALRSELNNQYLLLPYLEKNKIGFTLYDVVHKKALIMKEEKRISISSALFKLRYANPFASLTIPDNQINNEILKNKTLYSLKLNLDNIVNGLTEFGPFLAGNFLFKSDFLSEFTLQDNFFITPFDKKNPVIKISSGNEEKIFFFGRKEIIEFSLIVPKQTKLLENLTSGVISGLRYDQSNGDKLKNPQILEVIDGFLRGNNQTVLTYYINEAKKASEINNPDWRSFLKRNTLQTKLALGGVRNKNIEKSFDDVINTL